MLFKESCVVLSTLCNFSSSHFLSFFKTFLKTYFSLEREREKMQVARGRGGEREKEKERKSQAGSTLSMEPNVEFNPMTMRS